MHLNTSHRRRRCRPGLLWLTTTTALMIMVQESASFDLGDRRQRLKRPLGYRSWADCRSPLLRQSPHDNSDDDTRAAASSAFPSKGMSDSGTYTARYMYDNGLEILTDENGRVIAQPADATASKEFVSEETTTAETEVLAITDVPQSLGSTSLMSALPDRSKRAKATLREQPAKVVPPAFNIVLTHATADFDSLASAVGLAKMWMAETDPETANPGGDDNGIVDKNNAAKAFDSASHVPTFVVLPRGAHPGVQRFLALHKHLFPIRSLKSLPADLSGLNRLALVDAQRRDRLGPAVSLLPHANRVTVVDHHIDQDSDIQATDYVVDKVGSVTTLIVERLQASPNVVLSEAEATLLALGIHADTGSLCFDSTTPRDAYALAWCLAQGASQAAIAEHAQSSLSSEQQGVLTQALINANTTVVHGVTVATVLLSADGFINGLAAVTQDAMELSCADVFLLAVVYEAQSGGKRRKSSKRQRSTTPAVGGSSVTQGLVTSKLLSQDDLKRNNNHALSSVAAFPEDDPRSLRRRQLRAAFDRRDKDLSGYLCQSEVADALHVAGVVASDTTVTQLFELMDTDGNGRIDFDEFVHFANQAEVEHQIQQQLQKKQDDKKQSSTTMIVIGRVRAGVNLKGIKLHRLLEAFGGGGHAKAASATLRLQDPSEAPTVLQALVDELIDTSLQKQVTVGDFMTAPVLSVQSHMTENQVEDLFSRFDVRALPVVDDKNTVIGLVTYKEVAAAKQRLYNKEQKRRRRQEELAAAGKSMDEEKSERKQGSAVKGWMLQHVRTVEASKTMAQVESILLENDVGCIPVVDGQNQLVGMVTRTDLLRQHRYYPNLPYHNKGFADSIAARKPIIELRKKLKKFDLD